MWRLALLSFLAAAACSSKEAPPPAAPQACAEAPHVATASEISAIAKQACECTDDACVARAHEKLSAMVVKIEDLAALEGFECQRGEGALVELRTIHQAACACEDTACVVLVQQELESWANEYGATEATPSEAAEATELADGISTCMMKAIAAGDPVE